MFINIHAGHNPDGKTACGAIGLVKESTEARLVKNELIRLLRHAGHTVFDCTCENGKNQNDVLNKILRLCNSHKVSLDISVHLNSGANDKQGNGKSCGTEVLVYDSSKEVNLVARRITENISKLGFRNRGVKFRKDLRVLNGTNSPALLIECCFVDDADDIKLYDSKKMANAIFVGIVGGELKMEEKELTVQESINLVQTEANLDEKTMEFLMAYRYGETLVQKLAKAIKK